MDRQQAAALLTQNLTSIYGYAARNLYECENAPDLASDIIIEVLESIENLRDDGAFWGFVWKIAENTFRKFIRREALRRKAEAKSLNNAGCIILSPEEETVSAFDCDEQLYLIRRELSLLTKMRREVTVAYYIHNKTCSQIASEQNISVEMVKYYLFKTRRQLKDGVNMNRKLGKKSYDPGVFRIDFWGDVNYYNDLFDRRLRGSIVLAAYRAPMSAEELSIELGVAMPYLEEEIFALDAAGVLKKLGTKYQTNLVIITQDYIKEVSEKTKTLYPPIAKEIFKATKALLPEVRRLDFKGNDYDDNRLMFMLLNMAFMRAVGYANYKSPYEYEPPLKLGGHGWIWGHDHDISGLRHFRGVSMHNENSEGTAWFSAENYTAIKSCQLFEHSCFAEKSSAMHDAILEKAADERNRTIPELIDAGIISCKDGRISANYPVLSEEVYEELVEDILRPIFDKISDLMIKVSDIASDILKAYAPALVADQCPTIAKIHHRLEVSALLLEGLITNGSLRLPRGNVPLCIFGVKR
ncbi:MAG: sigma-70 family RNA polymerase sigma factor [Oscillospiraceae bacterium]|nr:sigma-70 family RNA polymerase sigma factor [Oscillospiraceae bacterium]